ncbi:IucA/IucC family protein [Patulibacter defluvii]|uniref:IucA/IucC family protein n=1 Tax=Patulibacter defluvii TaxID=3095358 RepID=UPI002A764A37|nr:IucA/IucC family protein [Patulibacter sp. DM4]
MPLSSDIRPPRWDPDARAAAWHVEVLLNCALREAPGAVVVDEPLTGEDHPAGAATAVLPVREGAARVLVALRYRSPTGRHRYQLPPRLQLGDGPPVAVELPLLAALVVDALGGARGGVGARLSVLERIAQSREAVAGFLAELPEDEQPAIGGAFLPAEQSLTLGHPFHPTPKSRREMRADERRRHSPESRGRFALRWLLADPALVAHDSAVREPDGPGERPAPALVRDLLAAAAADGDQAAAAILERADDRGALIVPAHPWQLARLRERDDVGGLLRDGRLVDAGPAGPPLAATTSVRTVYGDHWPFQLKFSLDLSVTNSVRVTLPRELDRAVEAARLARTVVGARMAAAAPDWRVVHDPAYLTIRDGDGLIDGLSVLLRENRWPVGCGIDAAAVTTLCQDDPRSGRSRLARIVEQRAAADGEPPATVARRWFARYGEVLIGSILRIYLDVGLTFEPHQQNVVLELEDGWPVRAVHRDSQGYFHREAAHADLTAIVPGLGEATESIFPEALADQRLVYYPFVNNALGVIGALGAAGLVDERLLLADLRALIERERERGGRYPATLLDRLLDDDRWPCKANLRTRVEDLDELVGDIAEQSVYVTIANPLRTAVAAAAEVAA